MKDFRDLESQLKNIDGRGYKAYESLKGQYEFNGYVLSIDHVQGDPFAPPSRVRAVVDQRDAKFSEELFDTDYKRIAVVDFLTRLFGENIKKYYSRMYGTGKSGIISIDSCGQEMLDRTSIVVDKKSVEVRFEVGLPASGRTVLGKSAAAIFLEALPRIIKNTLFYSAIDGEALKKQVELSEDQYVLRNGLKEKGLIAFIADGSILPRESGVSGKPMKSGAVPFMSPDSLKVQFELPHRGIVKGMGIPEGITLIVGGGYHGKSTILKSLESGVYNHIAGDGREFAVLRDNAVKVRAEDGRRVEKVDISPFINNLPNHQDTKRFSTDNASGSTSQAANIMEALEIGCDVLLMDEDTCATNFMFRDENMQKLVHKDKEPITPFIDRVRELYRGLKVSTILVAGSSGDYFRVADKVIMMEEYKAKDVTSKAVEIAASQGCLNGEYFSGFGQITQRVVSKSSFPYNPKGTRIKAHGLDAISYNHDEIDLRYMEQLVSPSQTNSIAAVIEYIMKNAADDRLTLKQIVDRVMDVIQ